MSISARFEATYPITHKTLLAKVTLFLTEKGYPPSLVAARFTAHRIEYTQLPGQHHISLVFNPEISPDEPQGGYVVFECDILGWDSGHSESGSGKPVNPTANIVALSRHSGYDNLVSELEKSLKQTFAQTAIAGVSAGPEKGVPLQAEGLSESETQQPAAKSESVEKQHDDTHLPPVTDEMDQRILAIVEREPYLTDEEVGAKVGLTRTRVNPRRKGLERMGYKVR